ncbi:hypothetical protein ONS95_013849 [Cadophora gregata]|uniref:uncharacterized protein n=1 Tax=Cadophora gregata TaxID=51156 RepID=UPI0026DCC0D2|nr:uncharacterized protein ONS95_013849 [Cadophora gregata]KAK0113604.1 hypothetical protein ONS96_014459 [Cadophora gregata f. sp. sojae]KAK0114357.1 hypothetical protein ONS95_013849 [Cadophora gregata]
MSRSSFFSRSSRDSSPLLPQHTNAVSLQDLTISPQISQDRTASPSPPPSFYADTRPSPSPSPSRTKARKIQFAAPPPPIATSVLLPPQNVTYQTKSSFGGSYDGGSAGRSLSPRIRRGSGGIDPLLGLERRERALQNDLQMLLDAQSAGLVQGFGGEATGVAEGGSDAGSSTPTSRSLQRSSSRGQPSSGIMPVRQPKRKVVGLRGARRGLLRDMEELVAVKKEEVGVLTGEVERREVVLEKVDGWEKRIEGVRGQLSGYSGSGAADPGEGDAGGEEAQEIAELRTEERAVDNEILEMEDRLAQMKARKRWLGERITESINRREARLSSYRGALREVEAEVKDFLRRPPVPASAVMGDEEGFTALPASRRTLGMAKEWWNKEISQLKTRQEEVEKEKAALEEGAEMWAASIKVVIDFEDDLRKQMASTGAQDPSLLRKQIDKMGEVIKTLSATLQVAEDRGWNLLICAVGAELEAFKEGEEILKGALGVISSETNKGQDDESHNANSTNGLEELNGQSQRAASLDREDSEDDGPNLAELLVDRGDHDP